ncbi:sensor histidine kinase [Desulfosporosinus nitroreducens]|uniref:sensor histidine kinase n=1 Tax=Desulfosporosinus nitroreducens TaxID=2018668 RepID=UPI00207D69C1|nr:HAMP domain-containing sensor histidine kinase [Desulfosporosinus nitroreducens]MCO1604219.1 HAMP domain-containing histidine kinase [Desulfosporosinus nitroreducens]
MKTNSLRFQLLARSLLLMAGLLVIIGLFQYVFMRGFLYKNTASSIQSQILAIPPDAWERSAWDIKDEGPDKMTGNATGDAWGDRQFGDSHGRSRTPIFFLQDSIIAFYDTSGTLSVLSNASIDGQAPPTLDEKDYQAALGSKREVTYKVMEQATSNEQLIVLQPIKIRDQLLGVVQVSLETKPLRDILTRQLLTFLLISLLALIGGMLAFISVLRKTLVPLSKMVETVEQIDAGNLAIRLPSDQGQEEIDRLADSFNGMLERLETSFEAEKEAKERMRQFVADASHELRTPLTSIHGFLEVLLRGAMNQPDKLNRSLTSMYTESERMKKLIQDLLQLAKLDRSPNVQLIEGELDEIIKGMAPQLRLLAGDRKVSLKLTSNLRCRFDEDKMKQVILNLFHNAVQHTDPEQGDIQVTLENASGGVELSVRDNGSGIPSEHLPKLFDRFYRSDSSRTRKYGGAGLGLAITKSLVELHGGAIRVESFAEGGTAFYVWFPQPCPE